MYTISGVTQALIPSFFIQDTTSIPGTIFLDVQTSDVTKNGAYSFVITGTISTGQKGSFPLLFQIKPPMSIAPSIIPD